MSQLAKISPQSEIQQFGCTISQLEQDIANNSLLPEVVAMDLVGDAQEKMRVASVVEAGQLINRARYILTNFCTGAGDTTIKTPVVLAKK